MIPIRKCHIMIDMACATVTIVVDDITAMIDTHRGWTIYQVGQLTVTYLIPSSISRLGWLAHVCVCVCVCVFLCSFVTGNHCDRRCIRADAHIKHRVVMTFLHAPLLQDRVNCMTRMSTK